MVKESCKGSTLEQRRSAHFSVRNEIVLILVVRTNKTSEQLVEQGGRN